MSDNLHTLFSGSECPPQSVLMDYFLMKLPEEEMHRIEEHLVDCEICSDVLEGLSKMNDPRDLDLIGKELIERIDGKRGRILGLSRNFALMAVAALFVIIAGSVVVIRLIIRSEPPATILSVMVKPEETLPAEPAATAPPTETREKDKKETHVMIPPVATRQEPVAEVPANEDLAVAGVGATDSSGRMAVTETEFVAVEALADKTVSADTVAQTQITLSLAAPSVNTAEAKQAKDAGSKRVGSQKTGTTLTEIGMEEFNAGHFPEAAAFFEQVAANQPNNFNVAYHLAYCYFMEKKYQKARKTLEPILEDSGNAYYSEAVVLEEKIRTGMDR